VTSLRFKTGHTCTQEDLALVDSGLDEFNQANAPLHEVQSIYCTAHNEGGQIIGGAVGRRWGTCCELQQLWVAPAHRRQGLGRQLIENFEAQAASQGCRSFFLETFNFQVPSLYEKLGYKVAYELAVFPHGIVKLFMAKVAGHARADA
jgi:ribosomal protein S18 acetylase RimI-like enzyme